MKQTYAKNVREVLIAAKWMLENVGWHKGSFVRYKKHKPISFCLAGALENVYASERILISQAVGVLWNIIKDNVVHYNDSPQTTKEDILALLDKAIANAKK